MKESMNEARLDFWDFMNESMNEEKLKSVCFHSNLSTLYKHMLHNSTASSLWLFCCLVVDPFFFEKNLSKEAELVQTRSAVSANSYQCGSSSSLDTHHVHNFSGLSLKFVTKGIKGDGTSDSSNTDRSSNKQPEKFERTNVS
jgi:hypothetical protein